MRRTHDEWETTGGNWRTPRGATGKPRRVTLDAEPWQSSIYSIPRPTRWTPEATAMDNHQTRPFDSVDRTPHPLQSPQLRVNTSNDEIQYLKERMHRQEDMMEKMMNEITLLRQELNEKDIAVRATTTEPPPPDEIGAAGSRTTHTSTSSTTGRQPQQSSSNNNEGGIRQREREFLETRQPPRTESRYRATTGSVGAQFVAEFSEFIKLDNGQHELLASIIDQQSGGRSTSTHF